MMNSDTKEGSFCIEMAKFHCISLVPAAMDPEVLPMKKRKKCFNLIILKEEKKMSMDSSSVQIHYSNLPESIVQMDSKRYHQSCEIRLVPWVFDTLKNSTLWMSTTIAILLQACNCESSNHSVLEIIFKDIPHPDILTQHPIYQSCWYEFDHFLCHLGSIINTCYFSLVSPQSKDSKVIWKK